MESESKPQCQYESDLDPLYVCKEPAQLGKDFCIFHDPDPEKDVQEFDQKLEEQLDGEGANPKYIFIGYQFPKEFNYWPEALKRKTFVEYASFSEARFRGTADFVGANFKEDVDFKNTHFVEEANFFRVRFSEKVDFFEAKFHEKGNTRFWNAEFKGNAFFWLTLFLGNVDFSDSIFAGELTSFEKTIFSKTANFSGVRFHSPDTLLHTDLSNVSFQECPLKNVDLTYAEWRKYKRKIWPIGIEVWSRSICKDDYEAENPEQYAKASDVCREIKQAYQRIGNYEKAGEFHFGEKECLRKSNRIGKVNKFLDWIYRIICGYGESASRVILFALSIIIAWTGFFLSQGFQLMPSAAASKTLPVLRQIGASLYLSVVTFTTLGLGDIHPLGLGSHILVGIESLIGAFTMALFVLVFARKFMR